MLMETILNQLEKFVEREFALVVKYEETWVDSPPGMGPIDSEITR